MDSLFPSAPRPYSPYAPARARAARGRKPRYWPRVDDITPPRTPAECEAEIERIARQLTQIAHEVPWGRVQNDAWDGLCQFIFHLRTAQNVRLRAGQVAERHTLDHTAFVQYALRRWFCFWGARVAELLFLRHPNVEPGPPKDHEVDFTIDGVPFDLKTSDAPRAFLKGPRDLLADPEQAATWFYSHQSRERRFHTANRLFLVLYDPEFPEEAWRLRADVAALRHSIDGFLAHPRYVDLTVHDPSGQSHAVRTAVILAQPLPVPRQLRLDLAAASPRQPPLPRESRAQREHQLRLPGDLER
jgi:hypothetical protein